MKEAFWDAVKKEVENGDYSQCVNLLAEIREQIESIGTIEKLPPTHPFRVLIADTLDIPLIKQQVICCISPQILGQFSKIKIIIIF